LEPASSWGPLDLGPIVAGIEAGEIVGPVPQLMARTDGVSLLYPGEVHSLAGEPESGKGWIALATSAAVIATGENVLYLDFEDAPASIVGRLLALGAEPEAILDHFTYVRPVDPFSPEAFHALTKSPWALVVIDGVSEAYALLDLDPYSNADAAKFLSLVARPLAETGAAVLLIDHVVKSKETRGRYAIGAQHKLAGIAAAYSTDVIKNPSRNDDGLIKIRVEKDRHGHVRGHAQSGVIALMRITPVDDGERVTVTLDPPDSDGADGEFRPTILMTRVAEFVASEPGASRNVIRSTVTGRGEWIDTALSLLISEGYIERRKEGQTHAHYTLRDYENEPSPTESRPSPGNSGTNRVPGSPPVGDPDPVATTTGNANRVPGPTI
jgi:KaiC/GvpD/RAD55 family RecA-like ATPase